MRAASAEPNGSPNPGAFMLKFARYWSAPNIEGMAALLTDDVVLVQPLGRATQGLVEGQAVFASALRWVPDIRAEVDEWTANGTRLFIAFRLSGSFAGRRVEWHAVDRIRLRGELACERISYFDPSPILRVIARRPAAWIDVIRSGLWRGVLA